MRNQTMAEIRELLKQGMAVKQPYEQVKKHFRSIPIDCASSYGSEVSRWAPDCEYVHELLMRAARPYVMNSAKILDLGAGNGRLSKLMLEAFDDCHITLLDVSASILSQAPRNLELFPGRFQTVEGDFFDRAVEFSPASFDCAISAFAICHGREDKDYRRLYQKIYDWLKPKSCFVCLDHVYGATIELTELGFQDWGELLEHAYGDQRASSIIKNAICEDSPLSLSKHLELLAEAGFSAVDVLWKKNVFALYMGVKI
jgi:tRNA (cmo5U34)-methyltransferase